MHFMIYQISLFHFSCVSPCPLIDAAGWPVVLVSFPRVCVISEGSRCRVVAFVMALSCGVRRCYACLIVTIIVIIDAVLCTLSSIPVTRRSISVRL